MTGVEVSEWNFSQQYALLWKEDEEKMIVCIYNKDFSGAGNILLASMTRYPGWVLKDFDPIAFYDSYMKEVSKYEELLNYEAPGSAQQRAIAETKINKKIGEGRVILHKLLDDAGILLRKRRETDEDDAEELVKLYAKGR